MTDDRQMTRDQKSVAHALIFLTLFGSAYAAWNKYEIWPFSHYPMYSFTLNQHHTALQLQAVDEAGQVVAISYDEVPPFGPILLAADLNYLDKAEDREYRLEVLAHYVNNVWHEKHPQAKSWRRFQVYKKTWKLEPGLANKNKPVKNILRFDYVYAPKPANPKSS